MPLVLQPIFPGAGWVWLQCGASPDTGQNALGSSGQRGSAESSGEASPVLCPRAACNSCSTAPPARCGDAVASGSGAAQLPHGQPLWLPPGQGTTEKGSVNLAFPNCQACMKGKASRLGGSRSTLFRKFSFSSLSGGHFYFLFTKNVHFTDNLLKDRVQH